MQRYFKFISLVLLTSLVAVFSACERGGGGTTGGEASQEVPLTEGSSDGAPLETDILPSAVPDSVQTLWEGSPHAQTYVTDDLGTNSTCAYCHAPISYIPSMEDMPESCSACKFEVAPPPPTIAESEWGHIPCNVCHRVKKGEVSPEIAWLSIPPIDEYEEISSSTDLCLKCHLDIDILDHHTPDLTNAHAEYTCTQCHDAHSTAASCSSETCHPDTLEPASPIVGHDDDHVLVTCWACHDGAGLEIGLGDLGKWTTILPDGLIPYASHNIVKEAACERCHFSGNPWDLMVDVTGSIP